MVNQILDNGPVKFLIGILVLYLVFVYLVPAACAKTEEDEEDNGFCSLGKKISELFNNIVDLMNLSFQYSLIIAGVGLVGVFAKMRYKNLKRIDRLKGQPEGMEGEKRMKPDMFDDEGNAKRGTNPNNNPNYTTWQNIKKWFKGKRTSTVSPSPGSGGGGSTGGGGTTKRSST